MKRPIAMGSWSHAEFSDELGPLMTSPFSVSGTMGLLVVAHGDGAAGMCCCVRIGSGGHAAVKRTLHAVPAVERRRVRGRAQ